MKISNSKKQLAKIIHENGGWREGAEFIAQDGDGTGSIDFFKSKPRLYRDNIFWRGDYDCDNRIERTGVTIKNWHQTILSRDEYFHLYSAPDAEGWIEFCESVMRSIPEPESKPTIEQMAANYRNKLDYANRKQDEADKANMESDAALAQLEDAIAEFGFAITPLAATEKEPELVITDWQDLQVGDVISVSGKWWEPDSEYTVDKNDGSRSAPIRVGGYWAFIYECSFKFIRRP